jgi:hypothetical protein
MVRFLKMNSLLPLVCVQAVFKKSLLRCSRKVYRLSMLLLEKYVMLVSYQER